MAKHLIIPDVQIKPEDDPSFLAWIGEYCAKQKPDVIVCIGDFADMPSLSSYDAGKKSFEGRSYQQDIDASIKAMGILIEPIKEEMTRLIINKKKRWMPRLVLTLGNHEHRIMRAIENDRKLDGLISVDDLKYDSFGWEVKQFLDPVSIDGVVYCHYFCSGVMGRPVTSARMLINKMHISCVAGHQQGRDVAYGTRGDGRRITSIIAGSCYLHDEPYLNKQTNGHWRGLVVLNEVNDGEFDESFVSMNYLKRKFS